jgi:transposase
MVHNTLVHFRTTNTTSSAPQSGCPNLINGEKEQAMKKIVHENPRSTLVEIQKRFEKKTNIKASHNVIRKSLHNLGFSSRIPARKPLLTDTQKENQLNWCLERQTWSIRKWGNVI